MRSPKLPKVQQMGNVIYRQLQYYVIYYGLKKKKIPDIDIAQNIQKKKIFKFQLLVEIMLKTLT